MTDFVTRLEAELHQAALRRERSGRLRGGPLPRIRVGLRDVPAAALATILLGLAVATATLMLSTSPEPAAQGGLPAELQGVWQAPPTELRLYAAGSPRCVNLGLGSSDACYTIGNATTRVADEWGTVSIDADKLTLRASRRAAPGVYRWSVELGSLRLTKLHDRIATRTEALVTTPLRPVQRARSTRKVPVEWTALPFTSKRFGYSIRLPHPWSVDTSGPADRFAKKPDGSTLPAVAVTAQKLAPGTSAARWGVIADSRFEASGCAPHDFRRFFVDGEKIRISVYRGCQGPSLESASFVHDGRGYRAIWRGAAKRPEADYPFFDALLKSIEFSP
jgi:hypothetical protein